MQRLGITHIYDLRSNTEIERSEAAGRGGVVEWEGCERVFVPVFTDQDYSPENLAERYKNYAADGTEVRFQMPWEIDLADEVRGSFKLILIFSKMLLHHTRRSFCIWPMNRRSL
jgi:hypothetical protein